MTMTKPTAKIRRGPLDFLLTRSQQLCVIVSIGLYFQYFVYRTERLMDSYLKENTFLQQLRDSIADSPTIATARILVFEPIESGQGIGNIMNGLLAAHMLGMEFNRTVCVSEKWKEFHHAFHVVKNEQECSAITREKRSARSTIIILNYASPPNECRLQERLSSDTQTLFFSANTYPRWANVPPDLSWDEHYKPTERLINILPYKTRPLTVVHLRQPDNEEDERQGLDDATLNELGRELPNDTFLVTNNVDWYTFFESYGWKSPGWHKVKHSALEDIAWGSSNQLSIDEDGTLELWSDWYTILRADKVYHTHSDFSLSAIHWNSIDSKTIQGSSNAGKLLLSDESWRVDEPMLRVVDRVDNQRNNCNKLTDDGFATFDDVGGFDDINSFDDDKDEREDEAEDNTSSIEEKPATTLDDDVLAPQKRNGTYH